MLGLSRFGEGIAVMKARNDRRAGVRGFSLIELIVVLVILGLLATVVGPKVMDRLAKGKGEIAKLQVDQLEGALGLFRFDVGRYPTTSEGLISLAQDPGIENWSGPYLDKLTVPKDPWGRDYQYRAPGQYGDYDLFSLGADGVEGGEDENADITSW
jgi:general secretion pathway protein G